MTDWDSSDPFAEARRASGVIEGDFLGEKIPLVLRYKDVREAAADYETYSSDAPFRVPIPSEERVRNMRQLPIETDPPEHTDYKAIVQPFFSAPKRPEMMGKIDALIVLEAGYQPVNNPLVEVVSTEVGITICGFYLKNTVAKLED